MQATVVVMGNEISMASSDQHWGRFLVILMEVSWIWQLVLRLHEMSCRSGR